jgi:hypothetical protein
MQRLSGNANSPSKETGSRNRLQETVVREVCGIVRQSDNDCQEMFKAFILINL